MARVCDIVFSTAPVLVEVRALIALFGLQIVEVEVRLIQLAETDKEHRLI